MRSILVTCILLAMFVLLPNYGVAASQATVTLIDGSGSLIRGTSRYALTKGIVLQQADIIELNDRSLAQIEFGDGTAVSFGERSRFMVTSAGKRAAVELFMLQGDVKVASPKGATPIQIDSPLFNVTLADATAVMKVSSTDAEIFSEVGDVKLAAGGTGLKIKGGEYCSRKAGQKLAKLNRPPQTFIAAIPVPFRDALPKLLPKIGNHKAPLTKPRDFSYDEVEAWLDSKPSVRKILVGQWKTRAHDPSFRKPLIHNINKHPEWDRVLFPEKYAKKAPKAGTAATE